MATREELQRRLQRILRWFLPVTIIMLVSTVLSLVGVDSEPRFWTRSILFGIAAVVFCVQVTRFSLWQRDEYWWEKDGTLSARTASPRVALLINRILEIALRKAR